MTTAASLGPGGGRARALALRFAVVGLGIVVFAVHATLYRDWLIDDSGISFAYALNLARGHGLVSQPGLTPVEGYSNPLWVFLLAALGRVGGLALPLAPKLVSGALVATAFAALLGVIEKAAARPWVVGACVTVACSMNPAFVIWCTSGLENALYVSTISALAHATLRAGDSERGPERAYAACGVLAALVAMTRPDGVLFALVPPVLFTRSGRATGRAAAAYAAAFGAVFGAFLGSRWLTFHRLLPNTAVVKGGPGLDEAIDFMLLTRVGFDKADRLLEAAIPTPLTNLVLVGTLLGVWFLWRRGRGNRALTTLLVFCGAALADYMLLPADWMGEFRFGTAFVPLHYAVAFCVADRVLEAADVRRGAVALGLVLACVLGAAAPVFAGRALSFARASNISLFFVKRVFAERFDRYADRLGVSRPSVLLPDVGGMLLWSHARVYDLAGLCDGAIARLAKRDPKEERDYVLAEARPTFIHTYGKFSRLALEADPRFYRDYASIHDYDEEEDPDVAGHASGLFVRRDAVSGSEAWANLDAIRRENHSRQTLAPPPDPSPLLLWLQRTALVPPAYRAAATNAVVGQGSIPR